MPSTSPRYSVARWSNHARRRSVKRVGARTQPCFTPLKIVKGSERSLIFLTWQNWSSCSCMTMLRIFGGQPRRSMYLLTGHFCSQYRKPLSCLQRWRIDPCVIHRHCTWSCLTTKTMSVVPLFDLKPHWLSGRWSSATAGTSLLSRTHGIMVAVPYASQTSTTRYHESTMKCNENSVENHESTTEYYESIAENHESTMEYYESIAENHESTMEYHGVLWKYRREPWKYHGVPWSTMVHSW